MANSEEAAGDVVEHTKANEHTVGATNPATPVEGNLWSDTTASGAPRLKMYDGSAWADVGAFDAVNPSTLVFGGSPAAGSAVIAARRDHVHGMPNQWDILASDLTTSSGNIDITTGIGSQYTLFKLTGVIVIGGTGTLTFQLRFNNNSTASAYMWENNMQHRAAALRSNSVADTSFRIRRFSEFTGLASYQIIFSQAAAGNNVVISGFIGGASHATDTNGGIGIFSGYWNNPSNEKIDEINLIALGATMLSGHQYVVEGLALT